MDESLKGRMWLWLRGEQAMGLRLLPVRLPQTAVVVAERRPEPPHLGVVRPAPVRPPSVKTPAAVAGGGPVSSRVPSPPSASPEALFISPNHAAFNAPVLPREEKIRLLGEMDQTQVKPCTRCRLCQRRTHTVFGEGDADASIFFIGEGPGETEDLTGRPFVGRAGQKLDEMIAAMGLRRDQVYIANIVKCRPPDNRVPAPDEVETCTPYLLRQLEIVRPKVIVTLGLPATRFMLQSNLSMGRLRGQWHMWRGIKLMPTFHPSYVLRNYTMETRKAVWSDLQKVMMELNLKPPRRGGSE